MTSTRIFLPLMLLLVSGTSQAQNLGIFEKQQDIGEVNVPGEVTYDSSNGYYELAASGETVGDEAPTDELFFVFNETTGNFALEASVSPFQEGRAGLMVRDSLEPGSPHASLMADQSFTVYPTFRTVKDGPTSSQDGEVVTTNARMRLEKVGNSVHLYTMGDTGEWTFQQTEIIPFEGSVFAGLAASSENDDAYGYFGFESVNLESIPFNVSRSVKEVAGGLEITLTASSSQITNATVSEIIPLKTVGSDFNVTQGTLTETSNTQQWVLENFTGTATLTYALSRLTDKNVIWNGTFTDGVYSGYIAGQLLFPNEVQLTPRGPFTVHPEIPTFVEAEWGTVEGSDNLWGLFFSPEASKGAAIQAIDGTPSDPALGIIRYPLNVQKTGQYYFFASSRAEEAQSDSVYIGFDEIDATADYGFSMPNDKIFQRRWYETYTEGGNFWDRTGIRRPFELTAGTHELIILTREKSAKFDWFVITPNSNTDMATFVPQVQTFAVSRDLPDAVTTLPRPVPVTLNLSVIANELPDITVSEEILAGWTFDQVKPSAGTTEITGNTLVWTYPAASADATLTYQAVPGSEDTFGIFEGTGMDEKNLLEKPIGGDQFVPSQFQFQPYPEPVKIGSETVFLQAEKAHEHGGDVLIKPDTSLVSKLYVEAPTNGRSGSNLTGSQFVFHLEFLQSGTYYVLMNARGESDQEDSFFIGFDEIANDGMKYGVSVSQRVFDRSWIYIITGANFWNVGPDPRPYEISAGEHKLYIHAREPHAKIDWMAITQDPTLDLETLLEPGQETAVAEFMLY